MKTILLFLTATTYFILTSARMCGSQPEAFWKFKTDGRVYGTPLIVDSVIYIGSLDGNIYAINRKTGEEIWNYSTGDEIRTTAVLCDTILCFGGGNKLYALNLSGSLKWEFTLYEGTVSNSHDNWDDFNSSPVLDDTVVYIGSEYGLVFGVNILNGDTVFHFQTPLANATIETTPSIENGKIYFGDWLGVFYCVDLVTSDLVWSYDTKTDNTYSWVNAITTKPVFYEGSVLFAGRSCNLYRMNAETGDRIWMYHDPQSMWLKGGPVLDDTTIYIGSSNQCQLFAFGINSGILLWQTKVDYRIYGTPMVTEEYLITGTGWEYTDAFGSLFLIGKDDHQLKAQFKTAGQVHSSPVMADTMIYFGCADEYVYAVNINALLDMEYPNTHLKDISLVPLGILPGNEPYSTSVYVYNDGTVYDSVIISTQADYLDISPDVFILNPSDSQEVTLTFQVPGLNPGNYTSTLIIQPFYSLPQLNLNIYKEYTFTVEGTEQVNQEEANTFQLGQNYPNPFSCLTEIPFSLPAESLIHLSVYNSRGTEIDIIREGRLSSGSYCIPFDATDLPAGIYLYRLQSENLLLTKTMSVYK